MKTLRRLSIRKWMLLSGLLMLLSVSCGPSNKNAKEDTAAMENKTKVQPPDIGIQAAIISGDLEAVKQHIAAGTNINEKDAFSGSSPLITAASFGKIQIAKALIDGGADLTVKNAGGSTALHTAAFFCRVEIVQLLLDAKADKTTLNNEGATARETVLIPFNDIKPVYEMFQQQLAPMGLQLDLNEIEKTRPVIAMMLE